MQTSAVVSPGSGSRGAGMPSCAYQNDMPPLTVLTVLMCPLCPLCGPCAHGPAVCGRAAGLLGGRYCGAGGFVVGGS
ncbi:hypothetical protein GCM10010327_46210 [Streptomyces nitrosporeus]|nr:hypothetical protein GCM10010327_46210 [Streptomyces nitrosporeus]